MTLILRTINRNSVYHFKPLPLVEQGPHTPVEVYDIFIATDIEKNASPTDIAHLEQNLMSLPVLT